MNTFIVTYFNDPVYTLDSDGDKNYPTLENNINRVSTIIIRAEDEISVLKEIIINYKTIYPLRIISDKDKNCKLTPYRLKKIYSTLFDSFDKEIKIERCL